MSATLASYIFQEELYDIPSPILVILRHPWSSYVESDRALLSKILGSVKIDSASVRILTRKSLSLSDLTSNQATSVLVFGSEMDQITPYQPMQAQGFTVVKADDLTELDDARKKSLWGALKQMFSV
jgi:DNA polymerase III psi subunit